MMLRPEVVYMLKNTPFMWGSKFQQVDVTNLL